MSVATRARSVAAPLGEQTIALIYARVSTDEQADEGVSIQAQITECRREVDRHAEWFGVEEFLDVESGTRADRDSYQRMMATVRGLALERRRVVVTVAKVDRLGRNLAESIRAWNELTALGVELHSIRDGGRMSEMYYNLMAVFAQEESRRIGERVRASMTYFEERGWHRPGRTPWGYRWRPATDEERGAGAPKSVLELHPDEAPYVAEAWQTLARGTSLMEVGRWAATLPSVARGGRNLNFGVLRTTFRAPVYVGRNGNGDDVDSVLDRAVGRWPALVTDELWLQVRANVDKGKRKLPAQASGKYLLTGFLRCDRCGSRMAGNTIRTTHKKSGICRTYVCTGFATGARREGTCRSRSVSADTLDEKVLRTVTEMLAIANTPEVIDAVRAAWAEEEQRYAADPSVERIAALDREIVKSRGRMRRNHTLYVDGDITREAYVETQPEYQREIEAAEAERARLTGRVVAETLPPFYTVLESVKGWYRALVETRAIDPYAVRAALAELLETVTPVPLEKFGKYEIAPVWTTTGKMLVRTAIHFGASVNLSSVDMFGVSKLSTLDTSIAA
jgi:site-specific DNA recombinase